MSRESDAKLPCPKHEEFIYNDWKIKSTKSHIMGSQCGNTNACRDSDDKECCTFCWFNNELKLSSLPDMVFADNKIQISHKTGATIEFCTLDALRCVSDSAESLEVAHAKVWKEARLDCEYANKIHSIKSCDWTYTSDYKGTLGNGWKCEDTKERIDLDRLRIREEIKFYQEVYLYEDELDDNGCTKCIVKIRVMSSGFFLVFRHYLRVDHVIIKVNDTRLYHRYGTNYILRESSMRQAPMSHIKVDQDVCKNPDLIWQYLPLIKEKVDKLVPNL